MKKIITVERFYEMFSAKSLILNRDRAKSRDNRPAASRAFFGIADLRQYLKEILSKDTNASGYPVGYIENAKLHLTEARNRWISYNNARPQRNKSDVPTGLFAEEINRYLGQIKMFEAESRAIIKIVEVEDAKEKAANPALKHRIGSCHKRMDGKIKDCDGREVDAAGEKFVDTGELVSDYLESIKARRRAKALRSRAQEKARRDLIESGQLLPQL